MPLKIGAMNIAGIIKNKNPEFTAVCAEAGALMKKFYVPGAAIGICHNGREYYSGLGVTSVETRIPVDTNTLFQVGSISKTFLAQIAVTLAEENKLDLDAPVRRYIPELKLKDANVAAKVTMRHLLTHTGGWFGDYFNDYGTGDDALTKMVRAMETLPQVTPLGKLWSYNNAGFYLAGRVIEKVCGKPYETVAKELIFTPLGMHNSHFFAEEVITKRFAVGHHRVEGKTAIALPWGIGRSAHPAGGIICSVKDLMKYARFHMGEGKVPGGKRLVSKEGMKALHSPAMHATGLKSVALSWFVTRANEADVISHGGATSGQMAELRIIPEKKFALIVFINGKHGTGGAAPIAAVIMKKYFGASPVKNKTLKLADKELSQYLGKYSTPTDEFDFVRKKGKLILKMTDKGGFPTPESKPTQQPTQVSAGFYAPDKIELLDPPYQGSLAEFLRDEKGMVSFLRVFSRIHVRLDNGEMRKRRKPVKKYINH